MTYNIDVVVRLENSVLTAIYTPNNSRTPIYVLPEYNHAELKLEGMNVGMLVNNMKSIFQTEVVITL